MNKTAYNLLIISGWGASNTVFKPLLDSLFDMSPLQNTITIGFYEAISHPECIKKAMHRLSDHPCFLLCWSCGALPALDYVSHASNMVQGLIIISGTARFADKTGIERWHESLVQQMADTLLIHPTKVLNSFSKKCVSMKDAENERLCSWFFEQFADSAPQALYSSLIYIKNVNMTENLSKIQVPACMISGKKDRICRVTAIKHIEKNLKAVSMHILEETGHAPHVFQVSDCTDIITHFIRNQFSQ